MDNINPVSDDQGSCVRIVVGVMMVKLTSHLCSKISISEMAREKGLECRNNLPSNAGAVTSLSSCDCSPSRSGLLDENAIFEVEKLGLSGKAVTLEGTTAEEKGQVVFEATGSSGRLFVLGV